MAMLTKNRSRLMLGAGPMALAISLTLAPERLRAQAIQASDTTVVGSIERTFTGTGTETITVFEATTVIDWTPDEDASGNALTFLPDGNVVTFQNDLTSPDFGVLNRILPTANGDVVVLNGTVLSRYFDSDSGAFETGGTIAFYSPSGIVAGPNSVFDVGGLILTAIEPSLASFEDFNENGGTLILGDANTTSTASVIINAGAQITSPQDGGFLIVAAPDVQMFGQSRVNGSQAFVGANFARLTLSNGLFDIQIPVGTDVTTPVQIDGDVGGPASFGTDDNHIIYAVAKAISDPISMIFRGNLGFDPAASAGVVNGEIILSANYDVNGRTVQNGTTTDGINAVFSQPEDEFNPPPAGSVFLEDFNASSSVLAIANEEVQVTANNTNSSVDGNLLMVGRNFSELTATNGNSFTITGDVLVSSRAFGVQGSSLPDPTVINAEGGQAFIDAFNGGAITIGGDAFVTADAFGGENDVEGDFGSATGGRAQVGSNGGTLDIAGNVEVSAGAFGLNDGFATNGENMTGGLAQVFAAQGGVVTLGGTVTIEANAFGPSSQFNTGIEASDVFGGEALLNILPDGGSITISQDAFLSANATGSVSSSVNGGASATGGQASVAVEGVNTMNLLGALTITADATGGDDDSSVGGSATGGIARAFVTGGGTLNVTGDFDATAGALGGNGTDGGLGTGGFAGARALVGQINLNANANAFAGGIGGEAAFGQSTKGGDGIGGTALFQGEGTLTEAGEIVIGLNATVTATGTGGKGGFGGGGQSQGGIGGAGIGGDVGTANAAQPAFGNGAFLLAGADNGRVQVGGVSVVNANGTGGTGGDNLPNELAGRGGDGIGGTAIAGISLFTGLDGSVGQGIAALGDVVLGATGLGGFGGSDGLTSAPLGPGGDGTGGTATFLVTAGQATANELSATANGEGGQGTSGGRATGGAATIEGSLEGSGNLARVFLNAAAFAGPAFAGRGADAQGGVATIAGDGIDLTITGDARLDTSGFGSTSTTGNGGSGTGGTSTIGIVSPIQGSVQVTGNTVVVANGSGGGSFDAQGAGGLGTGGMASAISQAGSSVQLSSAQLTADGLGGSSTNAGQGTGGTASLASLDAGSTLTISNDVPDNQLIREILRANGIGGDAAAQGGVGGEGQGGFVLITALEGGTITLPAVPSANDPFGALRFLADGQGGNVSDGGQGGVGRGGTAQIIIDGSTGQGPALVSTVSMGRSEISASGTGGSDVDTNTNNPPVNLTGGNAFGGTRIITVSNSGVLNAELAGGGVRAMGGNGDGNGGGGSAAGGGDGLTVTDATLNIIGTLELVSQATGGRGVNGGNALGGSAGANLTDATINVTPDAQGQQLLSLRIRGHIDGG
ncbi:MAG: hypothetical protein AAFZ11_12125, partial [Pseudomonadota bacterium]